MQKLIKYFNHLNNFGNFKNVFRLWWCLCNLILTNNAFAVNNIGEASEVLLTGTSFLTKFFWAACIFAGVYLLTAGIVNYKEHRNNPKMVPLSTVIVYVILGLIIIGIPFLSRLFGTDGYDTAMKGIF